MKTTRTKWSLYLRYLFCIVGALAIGVSAAAVKVSDSLIVDAGERLSIGIDSLVAPVDEKELEYGFSPYREAVANAIFLPRDSFSGNCIEQPDRVPNGENVPYDRQMAAFDEQIDQGTKVERRNSARLVFRQGLIKAVTSDLYVNHFVDGTIQQAVARPTAEETSKRAKALNDVLGFATSYAKSLTPALIQAEKEWLATCETAAEVEQRAWHKGPGDSTSLRRLVQTRLRFRYHRAGEWQGVDRTFTERDYRNEIRTFILRRIMTDGMTVKSIVSILEKFQTALKPYMPAGEKGQ